MILTFTERQSRSLFEHAGSFHTEAGRYPWQLVIYVGADNIEAAKQWVIDNVPVMYDVHVKVKSDD